MPSPTNHRLDCALRYHPDAFRVDDRVAMGRQSAGAGFLKGFIEHGATNRLIALADSRAHFDDFRAQAGALDRAGRETVWARPLNTSTRYGPAAPSTGLRRASTNRRGTAASATSATTASAAWQSRRPPLPKLLGDT